MRTTLIISDPIIAQVKGLAARQHTTISQTIEGLLRTALKNETNIKRKIIRIPTYKGGEIYVDICDRNALYSAMEKK